MEKITQKIQKFMFPAVIIIFIAAILSVIGIYIFTPRDITDDFVRPKSLEGWKYEEAGNNTLYITKKIQVEESGKVVCFKTYDSYVDAYINGKSIYHFGKEIDSGKTPGSKYHFIQLPEYTADKDLRIEVYTVYDNKYQSHYDFIYGAQDEIIAGLILSEKQDILSVVFLITIAIILLILFALGKRNNFKNNSLLYLGLLILFFSIWSSASTFSMQFLLKNTIAIYYLNYYALFLTCLLFILYMDDLTPKTNLKLEFLWMFALIIIATILHILGIADFTAFMKYYLITTVIIYTISIIKLVHDANKTNDRKLKIRISILFLAAIMQIFYYLLNFNLYNHTIFIEVGVYIYILIAVVDGIEDIIQSMVKVKDAENLEKIAYSDNLTEIPNRSAFERDLAGIKLNELSLISFDLNNLKYYNDNFGHAKGDILLKTAANALKNNFSKVYRIGGDEFIAIEVNSSEDKINKRITKFRQELDEYNNSKDCQVILEIAAGTASYKEKDTTYEDILKRADVLMYKDKAQIKANSKVNRM